MWTQRSRGSKQGYPRFHSKRGKQSATYPQGVKIHWHNGVIDIPKAGGIRAIVSRRFHGAVKPVTVRRGPSGKGFLSVLVEDENQVPVAMPEARERAVGGDLGIRDLLVRSTGENYSHPQWLENEMHRLKRLQRRWAKPTQGSTNRDKVRRQIARVHERVANRRHACWHQAHIALSPEMDQHKVSRCRFHRELGRSIIKSG